jgi:probable phosphoglycerate mutase
VRELVVVRHGESEGNAAGIVQGRHGYPLTDAGREQASRAAAMLRGLSWDPTHVVSSPVLRCIQTAGIVTEALGLPGAVIDEAFTEIDCGSATGNTFAAMREEHPGFFDRPASEWLGFQELGGESDADLIRRVGAGLDALPDERVLLVTHGAVFKGVLAHLLGLHTQFFLDLRYTTTLRLERRRIGTSDVVALTHFLHPAEITGHR